MKKQLIFGVLCFFTLFLLMVNFVTYPIISSEEIKFENEKIIDSKKNKFL